MNRVISNSHRAIPVHSIQKSSNNDLQLAIDSNQTANVLEIMKKSDLTNQPLPNGHMPLNYAIRHEKLELVEAMLKEQKLDTAAKDDQGLTVIDHAMIGKNPKMIALVLGAMIGQAFDAEIAKPMTLEKRVEMSRFVEGVDSLRSGTYFSSLTELNKAAQNGDLTKVKQLLDPKNPNAYDAYGMTPLHHAVLAGKKEVMQWLLQNGARADILTQGSSSLLHLASIGGHADLVSSLILTHKLNPNGADEKGRRPLHYAMVQENLSAAKLLIQHGANPLLSEGSGFSPLETMLGVAKVRSNFRDPLALSGLQVLMFAGIVAPWVSHATRLPLGELLVFFGQLAQALTAYKSLNSFKSKAAFWGSFLVTSFASSGVQGILLKTGDTTGARFVLGAIGALNAWRIYHVGKGALVGLSSCWKNRSLETYRPIRNAIIHSVTGYNAANDFADTIRLWTEGPAFLNAWDKHMETEWETATGKTSEGEIFRNLKGTREVPEVTQRIAYISNFYEKFRQEYRGSRLEETTAEECAIIPAICTEKLETNESLANCFAALNPKCKSHAQKILGSCDDVRALRIQFHPDRNVKNSWKDKAEAAYKNVGLSADILGCKV